MQKIHQGYIAGFLDGEGCVSCRKGRVRIQISQKVREPLDRIQGYLGYGKVYYIPSRNYYVLTINRRADVKRFIDLVLVHTSVKRKALLRAKELLT